MTYKVLEWPFVLSQPNRNDPYKKLEMSLIKWSQYLTFFTYHQIACILLLQHLFSSPSSLLTEHIVVHTRPVMYMTPKSVWFMTWPSRFSSWLVPFPIWIPQPCVFQDVTSSDSIDGAGDKCSASVASTEKWHSIEGINVCSLFLDISKIQVHMTVLLPASSLWYPLAHRCHWIDPMSVGNGWIRCGWVGVNWAMEPSVQSPSLSLLLSLLNSTSSTLIMSVALVWASWQTWLHAAVPIAWIYAGATWRLSASCLTWLGLACCCRGSLASSLSTTWVTRWSSSPLVGSILSPFWVPVVHQCWRPFCRLGLRLLLADL